MYGFIYLTYNKNNYMCYIGKCIYGRKNDWESYLGSGTYLKRAIKKYGKDNFDRIILENVKEKEDLEEREEYYIKFFNAVESKRFYNIKYTSIGGDTFTNNPNKENTRKLKSINSSGENNSQYNKEKQLNLKKE